MNADTTYSSYNLDHLGLIAGMVDELGLPEMIDAVIKQDHDQRHVSVGAVRQGDDMALNRCTVNWRRSRSSVWGYPVPSAIWTVPAFMLMASTTAARTMCRKALFNSRRVIAAITDLISIR